MVRKSNLEKRDVFISYRRQGGVYIASMLASELKRKGYEVFFDIDDIGPGEFDERLLEKIESSRNFVISSSSTFNTSAMIFLSFSNSIITFLPVPLNLKYSF